MEVLIQNNGDAPFTVPIKGQAGEVERTLFLGEHQVTKVSQEIYENFILTSSFFKSRMEDGTIRVLNADMIGQSAVDQANQLGEVAYQKYVDLMKKIRSAGGLANKQFQQYLNADGTPKLELLHANFGRNIDPEIAEQFRMRYVAEANEGMHEDTLKLPSGVKIETGVRDVEIKGDEENNDTQDENSAKEDSKPKKEIVEQIARIKEMNLGELKETAIAMGVEFSETATEKQLRKTLITKIKKSEE